MPADVAAGDAAAAARLTAVYSRLLEIDADGALARAATILNGLSFEADMIGVRPVVLFWVQRSSALMSLFSGWGLLGTFQSLGACVCGHGGAAVGLQEWKQGQPAYHTGRQLTRRKSCWGGLWGA